MLPRLLRRRKTALAGAVILVVIACAALLAPLLAPYDPIKVRPAEALSPPSWQHPFGTDQYGRDILSRAIVGARLSLLTGLGAVVIALAAGVVVGLSCGVIGGWTDLLVMRLIDIMMAFPGILLALVIITILGSGLEKVTIAVGIGGIPRFARVVRGSVLNTKKDLYVEAARSVGASDARIMFTHLVPQTLGAGITIATFGIATAILSIAGLSFLGLGAQPPTAEWGLMLSEARRYLRTAWWLAVFPGIAIMTVVLCVNLLGDAVRDALDPRISSTAD
jgi:peptide/nickel transport system permease protein